MLERVRRNCDSGKAGNDAGECAKGKSPESHCVDQEDRSTILIQCFCVLLIARTVRPSLMLRNVGPG